MLSHGNLEHALEVADFITNNIKPYKTANLQLAFIYGWLHDIGNADEYQPCKTGDREFKLTPSAYLHGHKLNGLHLVIRSKLNMCLYIQRRPLIICGTY